MKVLFVQYAGNFAEAYSRLLVNGEKENYYGQLSSVTAVTSLARSGIETTVLTIKCDEHEIVLEPNLKSVGLDKDDSGYSLIYKIIDEGGFDKAIVRLPDFRVFKRLRMNSVRCLPLFADSFSSTSLRDIKCSVTQFLLARELRKGKIHWVSNHQVNACKSLLTLDLEPDQILPYDHEHRHTPQTWSPSVAREENNPETINLFYAGALIESKGIVDLMTAVQILQSNGAGVTLTVAGASSGLKLSELAISLGLQDFQQLGKISHDEVLERMHVADFVIVPSHHSYPEGLPMTIMESLLVGTPVIASDHPMFVGRTGLNGAVKFYPATKPRELASLLAVSFKDNSAFEAMKRATSTEWESLVLELTWADLVKTWVSNPNHDFSDHSLRVKLSDTAEVTNHLVSSSNYFERSGLVNLIGVVVIGRNEGDRLKRCLNSLKEKYPKVAAVYVDSLSGDNSLQTAKSMGYDSISIGNEVAPSAALGRNTGAQYLINKYPQLELIQFLDGDSEICENWLETSGNFLAVNQDIGIVSGVKSESDRNDSFFGQLNGVEWDSASGLTEAVPGDMMVRVSTFQLLGGFDNEIIAAEDDDLCLRAKKNGDLTYKLNAAMSIHYGGLTTIGQWLRRAIRTGYAYANLFHINNGGYFQKSLLSAIFWGACFPFVFLTFLAAQNFWLAVFCIAIYSTMIVKIASQPRIRKLSMPHAITYGFLTMISKTAEAIGAGKYLSNLLLSSERKIIEYK